MKSTYELHDADTLPMSAYRRILKTGDLSILGEHLPMKYFTLEGVLVWPENMKKDRWAEISDSITAIIGVNDSYIQLIELKCQIIILKEYFKESGDRFALTQIDIAQRQLAELSTIKPTGSFESEYMSVCKNLGFQLDLDKTTVKQYFSAIKMLNESHNKALPKSTEL